MHINALLSLIPSINKHYIEGDLRAAFTKAGIIQDSATRGAIADYIKGTRPPTPRLLRKLPNPRPVTHLHSHDNIRLIDGRPYHVPEKMTEVTDFEQDPPPRKQRSAKEQLYTRRERNLAIFIADRYQSSRKNTMRVNNVHFSLHSAASARIEYLNPADRYRRHTGNTNLSLSWDIMRHIKLSNANWLILRASFVEEIDSIKFYRAEAWSEKDLKNMRPPKLHNVWVAEAAGQTSIAVHRGVAQTGIKTRTATKISKEIWDL